MNITRLIRNLLIIQQNIGKIIDMALTIKDLELAALGAISSLKQQLAESIAQGAKDKADLAFELTQNASDATTIKDAKDAADAANLAAAEAQAAADAAKLALDELTAAETAEDESDQVSFQSAIDAINLAVAPEEPEEIV